MNALESLELNLREVFGLPDDAVEWLLMAFQSAQALDDFADGDEVGRDELDKLIWNSLAGMPSNPFFMRHVHQLLPVLACATLQWKASDTAEREGNASAVSFSWRAGYYQLVLMAVMCAHGPDFAMKNAHHVMALYGEDFEKYMGEFHA